MSDLDGQDAFDRILDRLETVSVDLRIAQRSLADAQQAERAAMKDAEITRGYLETAEANQKSALPRLSELWEAAEAIRTNASCYDTITGLRDSAEMKRLQQALVQAGPYCDQIPF